MKKIPIWAKLLVIFIAIPVFISIAESLGVIKFDKKPNALSRSAMGKDWPFSVDEIELACDGTIGYLVVANGKTYALNGTASSMRNDDGTKKYLQLEDIWLPDPSMPGARISIAPIIQAADKKCSGE